MEKQLSMYGVKTGHLYLGSPYETYDSCRNCDGAKCHCCDDYFEVVNDYTGAVYYYGPSLEEANNILLTMSTYLQPQQHM